MPGLRDIGPLTETVDLGGEQKLTVRGLAVSDLFTLMDRFEAVKTLIESGTQGLNEKLEAKTLITTLPQAVWAIFAICTGTPDDKESEKVAAELPLWLQLRILRGIFKATFRDGIGPFLEMLNETLTAMTLATEATVSANGSQPPSPAALQVDMPPPKRGRIHRAN
jgi:hypothetical protein